MEEIWKPVTIHEYSSSYEVSNFGRVRSLDKRDLPHRLRKGKILKLSKPKYPLATLSHNGKIKHISVHRLVALAFIPNPENKPQVNHIDGNTTNNNVSNLEWATRSENQSHAVRTGLRKRGEDWCRAKLSESEVLEIHRRYKSEPGRQLAAEFGVSLHSIQSVS